MPYVDTVNDIVRVTMACQFPNSQYQEMTLHYKCIAAGGGDSRLQLVNFANSGITAYWITHLSNLCTYYGAQCSIVKAAAKWMPVQAYVNGPGSAALPPLPSQARPIISWKTQYAGPAYRGRTYVFTPNNGAQAANGHLSSAALTDLQAMANYFQGVAAVSGSSWQPGIYHRKPTADISSVFDAFASHGVDNEWATQKRSGDFGRPNLVPF